MIEALTLLAPGIIPFYLVALYIGIKGMAEDRTFKFVGYWLCAAGAFVVAGLHVSAIYAHWQFEQSLKILGAV